MYNQSPPNICPPRLFRDDLDDSIPWNTQQQSYMSRECAEHLNNVRQRMNNTRRNAAEVNNTNARASNSQTAGIPQHHRSQNQNVPRPSARPVVGVLTPNQQGQPQAGLPQNQAGLPQHPVVQPVAPVVTGDTGGAAALPIAHGNDDSFQATMDALNINEPVITQLQIKLQDYI